MTYLEKNLIDLWQQKITKTKQKQLNMQTNASLKPYYITM